MSELPTYPNSLPSASVSCVSVWFLWPPNWEMSSRYRLFVFNSLSIIIPKCRCFEGRSKHLWNYRRTSTWNFHARNVFPLGQRNRQSSHPIKNELNHSILFHLSGMLGSCNWSLEQPDPIVVDRYRCTSSKSPGILESSQETSDNRGMFI